MNAGITLHVEVLSGTNDHHIAESCFKGLARALRAAFAIDPHAAGEVPSTKARWAIRRGRENDMTTFTIHEPPPRKNEETASPVRFAFVRDGFYFWAFLLGPVGCSITGFGWYCSCIWPGPPRSRPRSGARRLRVGEVHGGIADLGAGWLRSRIGCGAGRCAAGPIAASWSHTIAKPPSIVFLIAGSAVCRPAHAPNEPPAPLPGSRAPTSDRDIIGLFPEPQTRP